MQTSLAAEALFGCPQDVEWAIAGQTLWVLQSRPIGTLDLSNPGAGSAAATWEHPEDSQLFWKVDEDTGKGYDLLLPLELSEVRAMADANQDCVRLLGAEGHSQGTLVFRARVYHAPVPSGLSAGDMRIRRAAYDDLITRLKAQDQTSWDHFGPEVIRATERLADFRAEDAGGPKLAAHLEDALAVRRRHYIVHPMIAFRPPRSYFQAFEELSGQSGPEAEAIAYRLVESGGTITSQITDELYELALAARAHPSLARLVASAGPNAEEELAKLEATGTAPGFRANLKGFLERFGARNGAGYGSEATIMTPTWREQVDLVLRMAAPYLDERAPSPAESRQEALRARDEAVLDLCRDRPPELVSRFRAELAYACRQAAGLEEHNHYIDQLGRGQLRQAILDAAGWLARKNRVASVEDVFWLELDEILAALQAKDEAGSPKIQLDGRIKARQKTYVEWRKLALFPVLGRPDAHLPERPPYQDELPREMGTEAGLVTGLGASAGTIRGKARVLRGAEQLDALQSGDILVAKNAGPRWTPFFPILAGLVLDEGSLGQHAAVIAREYHVPAVIATHNATRRIEDGAWILIDGTRGTVQILKEEL